MALYEFHFTINWFGHNFVGMDLGFNCNVTVEHIILGGDNSAQEINYNIGGQNSNTVTLTFPERTIGAEGVTIFVQSESQVLPQINNVTLYQPNRGGKIPYSNSQL